MGLVYVLEIWMLFKAMGLNSAIKRLYVSSKI